MAEYLCEQGAKQAKDGDHEGAIGNFSAAIMLDPNYAPAYYQRAEAEYHLEDYTSAAGDFGTAAALFDDPKDKANAYRKEAGSLRLLGKRKQSLESATKAIEADARCAPCYYERARTLYESGDIGKALDDLDKSISLNPELTEPLITKAASYMALGRYRDAIAELEKYSQLSKKPGSSFFVMYGYAKWGLSDLKAAEELFQKVHKDFHEDGEPMVALGKLKLAAHDLKGARELYNRAVWTGDYLPQAYLGRCVVEYLDGDLSTAYDDCVRSRMGYGVFPGAGHAMLFTWVVQMRRGQAEWARIAVKDFIEAANPVEWRMPALRFAAHEIGEKELLDEVKKMDLGGNRRTCEAYFILAQAKIAEDDKSAKNYLEKTIKACPPCSLERLAADYEINPPLK